MIGESSQSGTKMIPFETTPAGFAWCDLNATGDCGILIETSGFEFAGKIDRRFLWVSPKNANDGCGGHLCMEGA